jgi:multidrug efflux pump subunit AcrA (membrane-fusion protein)
VLTGDGVTGPAIPVSAVVDDQGQSVAYVEVAGEAFERRGLRLGIRDGDFVQVLDGLAPGERVVTRGAYQVRLAAASGAVPAHGHAH